MKSLFVLAAFFMGTSVLARGPQADECREGACLPNVTEEQKAAMAQHKEEIKTQIDPLSESFRTAQQKLRDLQRKGASAEEIAAQKKIVDEALSQMNAVRDQNQVLHESLLTPEQKEYVEKRKEIRETRQKTRETRQPSRNGSGQGEKRGGGQGKRQGQKRG